jgi:hypothetical protein
VKGLEFGAEGYLGLWIQCLSKGHSNGMWLHVGFGGESTASFEI